MKMSHHTAMSLTSKHIVYYFWMTLDSGCVLQTLVLRWVFTLFGAFLANSYLYKKTIFKEIPTKAIYHYEECLFCNTSKQLFNRNIISIL